MSRYILLPGPSKDLFVLVSADDFQQTKLLEVPDELIDTSIYKKVKSREKLNNLLYRLSQSKISKTMDGLVKDKNKIYNIKYDDAVISCCNNDFTNSFEEFYCILKKYGIEF